jgi:hypothetical protein
MPENDIATGGAIGLHSILMKTWSNSDHVFGGPIENVTKLVQLEHPVRRVAGSLIV